MIKEIEKALEQGEYSKALEKLYPIEQENQVSRYKSLLESFKGQFGETKEEINLFSSPGRTEIGGNHTDHQRGRVLAAAVQLDTAAVVAKTNDNIIEIFSEGYGVSKVDVTNTEINPDEVGTTVAVIRGVCARLVELGYVVGGFAAYCSSNVPVGSGISSSASFENLIATVLNELYNGGVIKPMAIAQISQYAENVYFGKPSGLMDQAASAIGGMTTLDFEDLDHPKFEFLDVDLAAYGYSLCVVNTGGDHADLTDDYAEITKDNLEVSQYFGKEVLRQVSKKEFYEKIPQLREKFGERAVLRGMHFFDDNQRVVDQVAALKAGDFDTFKKLVLASGESSFNRLQNVFSVNNPRTQPISLALEYSRELLEPIDGAWRVHGGGFAGTIQAYVPTNYLEKYKTEMDRIFGEGATQVIAIRSLGSVKIEKN